MHRQRYHNNNCTDTVRWQLHYNNIYFNVHILHLTKDDESLAKQNISSEWFTLDGLVGAALTELVRMSEKQ